MSSTKWRSYCLGLNVLNIAHHDTNTHTPPTLSDAQRVEAFSLKWPYYGMMTSSNGNIFRVTGPLCGEFTGHPLLFNVFINDIFLLDRDGHIYNYADDNCISYSYKSRMVIYKSFTNHL